MYLHCYLQLDWMSCAETHTHTIANTSRELYTTDPRPRMKNSRQGSSISVGNQGPFFLFFDKLILKNRPKKPKQAWVLGALDAPRGKL